MASRNIVVHMICPVCQLSVPNSEIMAHLRICLEKVRGRDGRKAFFDSAVCVLVCVFVLCAVVVVCVVVLCVGSREGATEWSSCDDPHSLSRSGEKAALC